MMEDDDHLDIVEDEHILQGEDMGGNCFGDMGSCNQEDKVQNYTD